MDDLEFEDYRKREEALKAAKEVISSAGYLTLPDALADTMIMGVVSERGKVWSECRKSDFASTKVIISKAAAKHHGMKIQE